MGACQKKVYTNRLPFVKRSLILKFSKRCTLKH